MAKMNEIAAAAHDHKRVREAAARAERHGTPGSEDHWPIVPIAIGVGSAALTAALLYANRGRKK